MLRALLADALGHAAVKGVEERIGLGWQIEQINVNFLDLGKGLNRISGVAHLRRFIS
jgi:hypothetical protein